MNFEDQRMRYAVEQTRILRQPKQLLQTFGTTNIYYYLLSEPTYSHFMGNTDETVIREGRVIAERPKIVTPYYLSRLDGFSADAKRYFESLTQSYGASSPGLFYIYRNQPKEMNIVAGKLIAVVDKLNKDIDRRGDPLVSIIKAEDEMWDVSLMKFIYEMTTRSFSNNVKQLNATRSLEIDDYGVPRAARTHIEELFIRVATKQCGSQELKDELDRWGLFDEYQDRFLALFRHK